MSWDEDLQRMHEFREETARWRAEQEAAFQRAQHAYWRQLAGEHFEAMLGSERAAEQLLAHPDPHVRIAALEILCDHWHKHKDKDFAQRAETMAFEDADPSVRCIALSIWGACYRRTDDVRVGKMLAEIVRNASEPFKRRRAAYIALYGVRGKLFPVPEDAAPDFLEHFRIPEDVDWSFVDSFLVTDRVPRPEHWSDRSTFLAGLPEQERQLAIAHIDAELAFDNGDYQRCIQLAGEVLERMPRLPLIYVLRGRARLATGRLTDAIADLSEAIRLQPDLAEAYRWRSEAYRQASQIELAENDLKTVKELENRLHDDPGK